MILCLDVLWWFFCERAFAHRLHALPGKQGSGKMGSLSTLLRGFWDLQHRNIDATRCTVGTFNAAKLLGSMLCLQPAKDLMPPRPHTVCTPRTHSVLPFAALEALYHGTSLFTGRQCCSTLRRALPFQHSHSARNSLLLHDRCMYDPNAYSHASVYSQGLSLRCLPHVQRRVEDRGGILLATSPCHLPCPLSLSILSWVLVPSGGECLRRSSRHVRSWFCRSRISSTCFSRLSSNLCQIAMAKAWISDTPLLPWVLQARWMLSPC